ncbi:cysteine desulfurase activator complex subunit SufB, partial [Arthrobacter sp. Hiyo6]
REGAKHSANTVRCDALLVDTISRSDTYPTSTSVRMTL